MSATGSISVVIPARNAADTLEEAVASLAGQDALLEIVVVEDLSNDDTFAVCRRLADDDDRVRIVRTPGVGIARALNAGFQAARGAFIARCDADDLYAAGRLAWQRAFLARSPDHVAVSSGYRTMTASGQPVADLACDGAGRDVTSELREGRAVTHFCTWLTRAEALHACGGARPWFVTGEDLDLQYRLAGRGRVWHEPTVGYAYRLRERSVTHVHSHAFNAFYKTQAQIFARQRAIRGADDLAEDRPPSPPEAAGAADAVNSAALHIANQLHGQAWNLFRQGGLRHGLPCMARSLAHAPLDRTKWRGLGAMILKGVLPKGRPADGRR